MQNLEAVKIPKGTILLAELDEIDLVYFFMSGSFDIGFEINKVPYYCIRYKNMPALGHNVGAYGCTFNQRSFFQYLTVTANEGFFIRKHNWIATLEEFPEFADKIKNNVRNQYIDLIEKRLTRVKRKAIEQWENREDYDALVTLKLKSNISSGAEANRLK